MLTANTKLSDTIHFTNGQEGRITRIARYRINGHLLTLVIVKKQDGTIETFQNRIET